LASLASSCIISWQIVYKVFQSSETNSKEEMEVEGKTIKTSLSTEQRRDLGQQET